MYADDPILGLKEAKRQRRRMAVEFVITSVLLGIRILLDKSQVGQPFGWIGVEIEIRPWEMPASTPLAKLKDLGELLTERCLKTK